MMQTCNVTQGSDDWKALRLTHFTASEAPVMMGAHPGMSRDELLTYKTTQVDAQASSFQQRLFDKGHAVEALARPIAERIIGEDLYPVTGVTKINDMPLLVSFDGLTLLEDTGFEHKLWNQEKQAAMAASGELLPFYYWQLEHQLLVSGGEKILFVMSDGTEDNWYQHTYESVPERRSQLKLGWAQFASDLDGYVPPVYQEKPEANAIKQLPALYVELSGAISKSNLDEYKQSALAFIDNINTELTTDQDFADAESTVKFCGDAEKELERVKKQALEQTADIAELFRALDDIKDAMRSKRLTLEKRVKSEKQARRQDIINGGHTAIEAFIAEINATLGGAFLPAVTLDLAGAVKGKRSIKSMQEAVNDEVARGKIQATETANLIRSNLHTLAANAEEHRFLFHDLQSIVTESTTAFEAIVKSRIADHTEAERQKANAEKADAEQPPAADRTTHEATAPTPISAAHAPGKARPAPLNGKYPNNPLIANGDAARAYNELALIASDVKPAPGQGDLLVCLGYWIEYARELQAQCAA